MIEKIKKLKAKYQYKECRNLINSQNYENNHKLLLALAECYYKDNELYYKFAFNKAIEILEDKKFKEENEKERLNLLGAVYKRYWEKEKKIEYLLKAIKYYNKAWNEFKKLDRGYGGVNAANLLDELGELLENKEYKVKADKIREEIIQINPKDKWDYHTLITAYFGLGKFDEVKKLIGKIKEDDEWEKYTTYETCYKLNKLKKLNAKDVLKDFFGNVFEIKKIGLALSGGGFRASLFHLGSLAALAEANKLKDISVISTVSGGSILGVLYYLKVKKLLESKKDKEIRDFDYIKLVDELINEFLDVITKKNLRNEVFFDMDVYFTSLTCTQKIAKLYEKYFYSKYNVRYLKDLLIIPKGEKIFNPRFQNFKRKNKVPVLVINTTNLNNGHNFQFHATKMGEIKSETDKNFRVSFLRSGCDVYDNFLISEAVAASSAVPGIFPALKIKLQDIELNLVDGGVYENIGLNALFSENVDEIIVSDGGYEMNNIKKLSFGYSLRAFGLFKYLTRTIDVLMDVNKDLIYEKIIQDKILNVLADSRKEFEVDCDNKKYNEQTNFEELFTKIRTDLDKFNIYESYAIIYFGYKKMKEILEKKGYKINEYNFSFKEIESLWESRELKEVLRKGIKFKINR
jgi:predicted acylesterase/phospholipase RssA